MLTKVAEIFVFQGNTLSRIIPLLTKNMPEERDRIVNIYVYNGNNTNFTIMNTGLNGIIRNNEWQPVVQQHSLRVTSSRTLPILQCFRETLKFFLICIYMKQFVRCYTLKFFSFNFFYKY